MNPDEQPLALRIYHANPLIKVIAAWGFRYDEVYNDAPEDAYLLYELPDDAHHCYISVMLDGAWTYTDDTMPDGELTNRPTTEDELMRWLNTTVLVARFRPQKLNALLNVLEE